MSRLKSLWRSRWVKVILSVMVAAYLGIIVLMAVFQRTLVYVPTRFPLETAQRIATQEGVAPWTNATREIIGWRIPARPPSAGSVLIAHGNGGSALSLVELAKSIHSATHLEACLLEYPGYGQRSGQPTETSLLAAADEAWETLPTNLPAYVVSESLGTGVAAHLAQKYPAQVAGVLMFVPYNRLASVAQSHYPWLPAYFLLRDRFNPVDWLQDYHGPVKIVLAGADQIIPSRLGQNLYDSYPGPKSLQIIPRSGHGGTTRQSVQWWQDVMDFWQSTKLKSLAP